MWCPTQKHLCISSWSDVPHLCVVVCVQGEAMIYPLWQHNHVTLLAADANPLFIKIAHIEVACMNITTTVLMGTD
jgi:hypothetical protein